MLVQNVHPDDRTRVEAELNQAMETGLSRQTEYRVRQADGSIRWLSARLAADIDEGGRPYRVRGVCIDISDHREAERLARELGGRLIRAQEEERRRLARDLHDDFNQRLALLSVELDLLGRGASAKAMSGFAHIAAQIRSLSSEVHKLSYQLHPAKLEQLGLEAAARSWCRDIAAQSDVGVTFTAVDVPRELPTESALCLYRILQEALRNVVRHSGASSATVELLGDGQAVRLHISDNGRGFDTRLVAPVAGLGLLSMRERIHLAGGTLDVQSTPGSGTRIIASVPLPVSVAV